jgi:hypothetical protein
MGHKKLAHEPTLENFIHKDRRRNVGCVHHSKNLVMGLKEGTTLPRFPLYQSRWVANVFRREDDFNRLSIPLGCERIHSCRSTGGSDSLVPVSRRSGGEMAAALRAVHWDPIKRVIKG